MVIDLFNRGDGLRCLKEIYCLNEKQIKTIEDRVFEYETPPSTDDEIEELIAGLKESHLPGETEESIDKLREELYDRSQYNRQPTDNCVEVFLEEAEIHPDTHDLSEVKISCRHIAAVIDQGDSIKAHGLLRLDELLERPSPLSCFLEENGISIMPKEHRIKVDGHDYAIQSQSGRFALLSTKLYHHLGETEVFVSGSEDKIIRYSCVRECPEILDTLDGIIKGKNLQKKWRNNKELLMIQFEVDFDECIIFKLPHGDCGLKRFFSREYGNDIPDLVGRNYWVIYNCLSNSSMEKEMSQEYAAIKPHVRIDADRLRITRK